jgi:putative MFS transporter
MVSAVLLLMSVAILALRIETSQQTLEAISPDIGANGESGAARDRALGALPHRSS